MLDIFPLRHPRSPVCAARQRHPPNHGQPPGSPFFNFLAGTRSVYVVAKPNRRR